MKRIDQFLSAFIRIWRIQRLSICKSEKLSLGLFLLRNSFINSNATDDLNKKLTFLDYKINYTDYRTCVGLISEIFFDSVYEFQCSTEAPLIVDAGANIGISALYFKHLFPSSRIICFEPDPKTYELLKENCRGNKLTNVDLHQVALSSQSGEAPFYSDASANNYVGMSLNKRLQGKGYPLKTATIQTEKLSSFIIEKTDLLKLDIEGSELFVLKDLAATNKITLIERMIIEYHSDEENEENQLSALLAILEDEDFSYILSNQIAPPFFSKTNKNYALIIYAQKRLNLHNSSCL
jgi:FkbM family methyltransferase